MVLSTTDNFTELIIPAGKNNRLYVCWNMLCRVCKIEDSIKKNLKHRSTTRDKKIRGKKEWRFNSKNEVDILSIPPADRQTYRIPQDNETLLQLIEVVRMQEAEKKLTRQAKPIDEDRAFKIETGVRLTTANHAKFFNAINERYPNIKNTLVREYATRCAVAEYIKANYQNGNRWEREIFFNAYHKVLPTHFDISKKTYLHSFSNYLSAIFSSNDLISVCVDSRSNVKAPDRRPAYMMELLEKAFATSACITAADAYRMVSERCRAANEPCQSKENVKKIWAEFKRNDARYAAKYGEREAAKRRQFTSFIKAENRLTLVQCDGKVVPFFVQKADGKGAERWTVFLVQDSHSYKYIYHTSGRMENAELMLPALEGMVKETGYWPHEIIFDKHSATKVTALTSIFDKVQEMGAIVDITTNPQAKAMVERENQNLDAIWKLYPHYLGKGVTSKTLGARPTQEAINEAYKPENYKTAEEIRALITNAILKYNNTPKEQLGGLTPNEAWERSQVVAAYKISDDMRAKLFKPVKVYKVIRGQITIYHAGKKHEYQLSKNEYHLYNDLMVEVSYEDLYEGIYLYEVKTGNFIGYVPPKEKIKLAKFDRTERDYELLNRQTGRKAGINKAAIDEVIKMTSKQNPDLDYSPFTKDIRKDVADDRQLRTALAIEGVDMRETPDRTAQIGAADTKIAIEVEKHNKRPFAPKNHKTGMFNPSELINDGNDNN